MIKSNFKVTIDFMVKTDFVAKRDLMVKSIFVGKIIFMVIPLLQAGGVDSASIHSQLSIVGAWRH